MQAPKAGELLTTINRWVEVESKTEDVDGVNGMMDLASAACGDRGLRIERMPGRDGFGDCVLAASDEGEAQEPGILVLSHLDTVHPKGTLEHLPIRTDGDHAYGPGIYDMKGGAYIAIVAYGLAQQSGEQVQLPVRFLYVSDEEVGSPVSQEYIESEARRAKYVLVTEPARDGGKLVTGRKGSIRMTITTHGVPSHSGVKHEEGRSAILEMAHQIIAMEGMTDYERGITVSIGLIEGGTGANVVPARCEASIDVRVTSKADADEMIERINGLTAQNPDVRIELTGGLSRPPYEKSDATAALFEHAKSEAAQFGLDLEDSYTGGGSDGNFTAAMGVPTLDGLGVVGAGAHTLDEHLLISSLEPRTELMRRLFLSLS